MPSPEPKRVLDPVGDIAADPFPGKLADEPPAKKQKVDDGEESRIAEREAKWAHVPQEIDGVERPMWFAACMEDYDKPYYDNEDQATIEALPELPQTKVFVSRQKLFDDFKELWDAQNFQSQQEVTGDTTGQQTQKSTVEDGDALLSKEDQEKADFMARLLETDADVEDILAEREQGAAKAAAAVQSQSQSDQAHDEILSQMMSAAPSLAGDKAQEWVPAAAEDEETSEEKWKRFINSWMKMVLSRKQVEQFLQLPLGDAQKVLVGALVRLRLSPKRKPGKEPRKEGEKVVVKIMAVEPCEPYHVQSCHKIYRHKLIVQRRKKGKEANREVQVDLLANSFRDANGLVGSDTELQDFRNETEAWLTGFYEQEEFGTPGIEESQIYYNIDLALKNKIDDLIYGESFTFDEELIAKTLKDKGAKIASSKRFQEAKFKLIEIRSQLESLQNKDETDDVEAERAVLLDLQEGVRSNLTKLEKEMGQERRNWEENESKTFRIVGIQHMNDVRQRKLDEDNEAKRADRENRYSKKVGLRPGTRRECMPDILWGMVKERRAANKVPANAADAEKEKMAAEAQELVSEVSRSAPPSEAGEASDVASVTSTGTNLPPHDRRVKIMLQNHHAQPLRGKLNVDELTYDMDQFEKQNPGTKAYPLDSLAGKDFNQNNWTVERLMEEQRQDYERGLAERRLNILNEPPKPIEKIIDFREYIKMQEEAADQ